ncbi:MAG: UDP-glucose 4-epimerase GalE [Thermodesulfobacteriota bacterium]
MSRHILVIGGAGYVGSHFVRSAIRGGYRVTVLDDLSTGHRIAVGNAEFLHCDLNRNDALRTHLESTHYDALFHFAASCLVGESVGNPALYYRNNVLAAFRMLEAMRATSHDRVVFSSTCAVYGIPQSLPLREDHPKAPISPYGRTKLAIEWMLEDYQTAYGIRNAALRYFNAAGCEPKDGLGEDHDPETHLIPNVVRFALNREEELVLFGDDYPTPDGTCIRDYIHVTDLADAHLRALDKLDEMPLIRLNLGTGRGHSNREVVQAVSDVAGIRISPAIGPRRPGDPPELTADAGLAFELLQWRPTRSGMHAIVEEVIEWMQSHPHGYQDRPRSDRMEGAS